MRIECLSHFCNKSLLGYAESDNAVISIKCKKCKTITTIKIVDNKIITTKIESGMTAKIR